MPGKLVSVGEAARALGINEKSLSRWARLGKVTPAMRTPGGHYRFDVDKLREELRQLWASDRDE